MSVFGFVWASLGVAGLPGAGFLTAISAGTSVALVIAAVHLYRASATLPTMPPGTVNHARVWRRFQLIGIAEGIAIGLAVFVLARLGYPEWIPATVALVVGLHFFPLASLFGVMLYYATGALLCGVFVVSAISAKIPGGGESLAVMPGIGSAFVLWVTAGLLVAFGVKKRRAAG